MVYDFGLRLKSLREWKKLTQEQVARRLNLTKASISAYENNTSSPHIDVVRQLSGIYGVTSDYILGIDNKEVIVIDGLTPRQKEIIRILLTEFRENVRSFSVGGYPAKD